MIQPSRRDVPEPLAADTSPDVEARQLEAWGRMSSVDIARTIAAAWSAGQQLVKIGLRERFPDASEHELRVRLAIQVLGPELAGRIHPDAPQYAGD